MALLGPAAVTSALLPARDGLSVASVALLFLPVVVVAAALGGTWTGLAAAIVSDLGLNWFFVPPFHTFSVESGDNVVTVVVYALVAAAVAILVEVAARQRVGAERTLQEVRLLARATQRPLAEQSVTDVLQSIRETFAMTSVALYDGGHEVERVGESPGPTDESVSVLPTERVELVATGPATLGIDRRLLGQLAGAAARIVESRRLAGEAARASELAEIDRLRSALLAAVGHDLRTPLTGIKAAITSLREPGLALDASARAELEALIEESTDALDGLITNLLAMSRLQAGVLSVTLAPTSVEQVCATAAAAGGPSVALDVPEDLEVLADAGLLERVIANLLDNAMRYGPSVLLVARRDGAEVTITVVDHGPGVPAGERERIFAPFQRLGDRTAHAGPGLGLAIAQGFTSAMSGSLVASETDGGGLTMTIRLPAS